jgi:hypothetical protein
LLELVGHLLVVDRARDVAEHPERRRTHRAEREPRHRERDRRLGMVRVPYERVSVAVEYLDRPVLAQPDRALAVLPEPHGLAVLEVDPVRLVVAHGLERIVVVDVAVLEDLDERGALVHGGRAQHLGQLLAIGVDRARDERRVGPIASESGLNGLSIEPIGVEPVRCPTATSASTAPSSVRIPGC